MNIAIYGKGGIGKSTIASNVSVKMAMRGLKVLQIGCDPKHDSTLLLLKSPLETVLENITNAANPDPNTFLQQGLYGIDCIEIGGPVPGVGCAGRGIIKGLEILDDSGLILRNKYDLVIYDVLGDVVCGGFFEPLRKKRVEKIFIVTSGEFNSLFAANNICMGYVNCKLYDKNITIAGIIGNYRNIDKESEIVKKYCQKVGLPLITEINRDNNIEYATSHGSHFVLDYPDIKASNCIEVLCDYIEQIIEEQALIPTPLTFQELRGIIHEI